MKRCIAIFGPTASGKSSLAIQLALKLNGIIISADSMQIYRELNIGTAKPSQEELNLVPHKMIDICSPCDSFSVYDYKKMAEGYINEAISNGKTPILVGGTGLYFDAMFFNTDFGEMKVDESIHSRLVERFENGQGSLMLKELQEIDPNCAEKLHEKDAKRIIRGLEVFLSTGTTLTDFKKKSRLNQSDIDYLKIFLDFSDRQKLYQRINARVDKMIEDGLIEETKNILEKGYLNNTTASQAIGYKEFLPYFAGEKELNDCIDLLKQKSRNYAKRQLTWFRRYTDANRIEMDAETDTINQAYTLCKNYLKEN
ncbi:MAG: tRNA (adenosine(37)-N6)-dimethylallyltransferase MiaA [Clostridia bacterium]|nr:tRNA (adenosine(37)-N6)-dimethylallyltransferase MiaA [Clostridia bacterium]